MRPGRVLVVAPFGIGDVLFTFPMLDALRRRVPGVLVDYCVNARVAPLLESDPRIRRLLVYERDVFAAEARRSWAGFLRMWSALIGAIRAERYDLAFDLSMGSPLGLAIRLAGIPRRAGYDYKGRGRWLSERVALGGFEGRPVALYHLDLLDRIVPGEAGVPVEGPRPQLWLSASASAEAGSFCAARGVAGGDFVVVHPGGGASWGGGAGIKRWPPARFAALADRIMAGVVAECKVHPPLEKTGCPVILLGDKSEAALCAEVAGAMKAGQPVVAAGVLTLPGAAALMARARCVVANDGGPLHLAVAAGARTVSIFGPVDPGVYGPFPPQGHRVAVRGLPCQPCYRRFRMTDCAHRACLSGLTVDAVYDCIKKLG